MTAETRYARSGDVSIAYQVSSDGPFDIVFVPPSFSHVELAWQAPGLRMLFERLGSLGRLIHFDKRGTGMSDRGVELASLETRMDDVRAVMDAAGSTRAAIFGLSEGVAMSALFAATYPDRTWALVLYGGYARTVRAPDYPWGLSESELLKRIGETRIEAEEADYPERLARSGAPAADEEQIAAIAQMFRNSGSPGAAEALARMNLQIDVREALSAIRTPTLVLHNTGDTWIAPERGRDVATRIPTARFVELPIDGHIWPAGETELVLDAVEPFLRESWQSAQHDDEPDRILATVLFTDIADSTARMAQLGDAGWRELLERHHALVRRELSRGRGREVDTAGDGFFAAFDGPARAVRCARAITEATAELGLGVRAGLHTGECELVDGKIGGIAVHTGARVAAHAEPGEVLVSSTVRDLVAGSGLEFEDRGVHELKGLPGEYRLYAAV